MSVQHLFSTAAWNEASFHVHTARIRRAFLILVFLVSLVGVRPVTVMAATAITFTGEELLGKPTDTSIAINIVPDTTIEYFYEYGTNPGGYGQQTSPVTAAGGQPHEITISGLAANTRYYYRMQYHLPGETDWIVRSEHSFQTQRSAGEEFVFAVTSDSHATFNTAHQNAMVNVLNEQPDFLIDLGDTFYPASGTASQSAVNAAYLLYRDPLYMERISHSVPIFLASGNHEEEEGWNLDDTPFSIGVGSIQARKAYYPTPIDDGFYSGNIDPLPAINEAIYGDEYREDYYAWEWGDALFVVIDEFQYTMNLPYSPAAGEGGDDSVTGDQWSWTLGEQQYTWLKQTLENSHARYKFVFSHNMTGGITRPIVSVGAGYVRGGAEAAKYFEWGGYNADGTWGFGTRRPGWEAPIHQLFVDNGVSAYFHGHDHQYVYETRDGVVYQEVPSPSMSGSGFGGIYTEGSTAEYNTIEMLPSTGHLKISVTPAQAQVAYVSSSSTAGTVNYTYTIEPNESSTDPGITIAGTPLGSFSSQPGVPSTAQVYTVSGTNLTGAITITPPADFEISLNGSDGWTSSSLTLTPSGTAVAATPLYVRLNSPEIGNSGGNIVHTSPGATSRSVPVSGAAASGGYAVAQDGEASSGTADDVASLNFAHITGMGADRLMLVGVSWNCGSTDQTISTVTFTPDGGSAMPLSLVKTQQAGTQLRYSAIYSLLNPPGGAAGTVNVTFSGSVANGIVAGAVNFAGVDQTTPLDASGGASGQSTAPSLEVTGLNGDELVFDQVFMGGSSSSQTLTAGAGQTQHWNAFIGNTRAAASTKQAVSSAATLSWTAGSSAYWAIAAVPINPAPAGATHELSITASPADGGTTAPELGVHTYAEGTSVNITANPNEGYEFDHWSGDCSGSGACSVVMSANRAVVANFRVDPGGTTFVTLDGAASSGTAVNVASLNIPHTTGTGADRLMLVGVSWNSGNNNTNRTISSLTFTPDGGSALDLAEVKTQVYTWGSGSSTSYRAAAIYSLVNPPSGTSGTVAVTFSGAVSNGIVVGAANFAGVDQATPLGTPGGANGTGSSSSGTPNPSLEMSGLSGNELVFDTVFIGVSSTSHTLAVDAGQSELWNVTDYASSSSFNTRGAASSEPAAGASVTMSWTAGSYGTTATRWAIAAVPVNPAPAGATHTLTITASPAEGGTTAPELGVHTYAEGTSVNITASPNDGYEFDHWSGDCSGSGACSVAMSANRAVVANFRAELSEITFTGAELLGRPTDTSISISAVPDADILLRYQYGTVSGSYTASTAAEAASAGTPEVVEISGLTPNTKYYYRMQYSTNGGLGWLARPEHSFWTQRAAGSTFTFDITTDSHVNIQLGNASNWTSTMNGVASDNPDFLIDLGDTFAMDNGSTTVPLGDVAAAEQRYKDQLPFFNIASASSAIYIVAGNHEQQEAWHLQGTLADSMPAMGKNAEKKFFLNPVNDSFYSGDTSTRPYLSDDQLKQDYFAWTWGDALFVVISPFWTTTTKPYTTTAGGGETDATGSGDRWDWTLGLDQFNWLRSTLEGSTAKYKFVFAHQIVGGNGMTSPVNQVNYGHGGVDSANLVEWGGNNVSGGASGWATERAGWGSQPIRQMLEATGVTAFFHGHDHQYAYESLNGMVYQSVPSGSFTGSFGNYTTGGNSGNTIWADSTQGAGHLKVTVGPEETRVDFIRYNGTSPAHTYTMTPYAARHTLTVSANPTAGGTTSPAAGAHSYAEGAVVSVTAAPASGYTFDHWSGACTGTGACSITMSADQSVTAHFVQIMRTLTITASPTAGGTTSPAAGAHTYAQGTAVTVTAAPASGYTFDHWSGACTGTGACSITMSADQSVTAHFVQIMHTLTVYADPAAGGTTSPAVGEHTYAEGTAVTVTAAPASGYTFDHWSGACTGNGTCSITMGADRSVTAHFVQIMHTLTVFADPAAGGTTTPAVGAHTYAEGTVVEITAAPASDYTFDHWSGSGITSSNRTNNPLEVTITSDMNITAVFVPSEYTLTINVTGSGSVTRAPERDTYQAGDEVTLTAIPGTGAHFVSWAGGGLSGANLVAQLTIHGNTVIDAVFASTEYSLDTVIVDGVGGTVTRDMAGPYHYNDVVHLTAVPDPHYRFVSWGGAASGSELSVDVTITGNILVSAQFEQIMHTLTVSADPETGGTTSPAAGAHSYAEGTVVSVTAAPASGYTFDHWSGACTGTGACSITMGADQSVTAHFVQIMHTLTITASPTAGGATTPAVGEHTYAEGTVVEITAAPASDYTFDHWSGSGITSSNRTDNPLEITITGDMDITAVFVPSEYTLTINVTGKGSVTRAPEKATYQAGDEVTLTAVPSVGAHFVTWTGALSGTNPIAQLTISGDMVVYAVFADTEYTLDTVVIGGVGGTVTRDKPGPYHYNDVVRLTAVPGKNYHFTAWSGDASGSALSVDVTITGNKLVSAQFAPYQADLSVSLTSTPAGAGQAGLVITVANHGPDPADGAAFEASFGSGLENITWTCTAQGGAACPHANGSNSLNETIAGLPGGGSLTYTIIADLRASGDLSISAEIAAPAGINDPNSQNNTAALMFEKVNYRVHIPIIIKQ